MCKCSVDNLVSPEAFKYFILVTSNVEHDDDSDTEQDEYLTTVSSAVTKSVSEIPLVEGSVQQLNDDEDESIVQRSRKDMGEEETDSNSLCSNSSTEGKKRKLLRSKRKSVTLLPSCTSDDDEHTEKKNIINYWKPKSLLKSHKITIQVHYTCTYLITDPLLNDVC